MDENEALDIFLEDALSGGGLEIDDFEDVEIGYHDGPEEEDEEVGRRARRGRGPRTSPRMNAQQLKRIVAAAVAQQVAQPRKVAAKDTDLLMAGIKTVVVPPGETVPVKVTVSDNFRADRLVLGVQAQQLLVTYIRIGRTSQNLSDGPIPGNAFAEDAIGTRLRGTTATSSQGIDMEVRNPLAASETQDNSILLSGAFFGPAA